jgi:hypothetical protein
LQVVELVVVSSQHPQPQVVQAVAVIAQQIAMVAMEQLTQDQAQVEQTLQMTALSTMVAQAVVVS